ncbi:MAG: TlpA family protein disulfide reductase [Rhizobium sp.]|nr:TlpA family protein disulfide reductase [Rhizobium sp.]
MTEERRRSFLPSLKLLAVAAVAGVIAGGVAVYMRGTVDGNGPAVAAADCTPAKEAIARIDPLATGQVAAFITEKNGRDLALPAFKGPDGKDITLAAYAGKVQLINLWATWCVPCREEMPALNALQKALGGEKFQVTAINLDTGDASKPTEFLTETKIDALPLHHDATLSSFNQLKKAGLTIGLPVSVLIDGKGCMLGALSGPAAWESDDAKALIRAAIGEES